MADGRHLTRAQAWCLYLSHFLSMWNSRAYEYGAVLFTQAVFPGDLLPSSLYGIAETVCVLVSSTALGRMVDDSPNRLRPLLFSIVTNRVTIVACCVVWLFELHLEDAYLKRLDFAFLLLLGMVVKVSRMSNMLSMERDWIPTVAASPLEKNASSIEMRYDLTHLNTVMRRIDITCKFLAPVATSGTMALVGTKPTAFLLALMSLFSAVVEVWSVVTVWRNNLRLRASKETVGQSPTSAAPHEHSRTPLAKLATALISFERLMIGQFEGMRYYFSTNVWLPSIGVAVLHASVLDWSGTLISWLLNAGFTYTEITVAKGVGSIFEVGSTFVFPALVTYFRNRGPTTNVSGHGGAYQMVRNDGIDEDEEEDENESRHIALASPFDASMEQKGLGQNFAYLDPIVGAGHVGMLELLACLVPTVFSLFYLDAAIEPSNSPGQDVNVRSSIMAGTASAKSPTLTFLFFSFISFSFLGRWIYDLSVTQLTQTLIPASHRSQFGGTEMAMIAGIGLLHWIAAAVWHLQEDYKWLAVMSLVAVALATGLWWIWRGRWIRMEITEGSTSQS